MSDQSPQTQTTTARERRVEPPRRILAVDDDRIALMMLEEELRDLGYEVSVAENGTDALSLVTETPEIADVIVLDKQMPGLDGLAVVRRLKTQAKLRNIPVVMLTGDDDPSEVREGVDVGVFHYLTKPLDSTMLKSVLNSALRDAERTQVLRSELQTQRQGFSLIDTCKLKFRTLDDAWNLASFLASCFPDPERVLPGVAELLINAIEHGNLGVGFETKSHLLKEGRWREEVEQRLQAPEYRDRVAEAVFTHRDDGVCVVITDKGAGFDWRRFMKIDPSRGSDSHGRGIAQARTASFDKLVYNAAGNQVVGFVSLVEDIDW